MVLLFKCLVFRSPTVYCYTAVLKPRQHKGKFKVKIKLFIYWNLQNESSNTNNFKNKIHVDLNAIGPSTELLKTIVRNCNNKIFCHYKGPCRIQQKLAGGASEARQASHLVPACKPWLGNLSKPTSKFNTNFLFYQSALWWNTILALRPRSIKKW